MLGKLWTVHWVSDALEIPMGRHPILDEWRDEGRASAVQDDLHPVDSGPSGPTEGADEPDGSVEGSSEPD